ncbi:MAG: 4-diphosphocytidyl-2-C-methyl-D-erythritol kinase [Pseudonocardiales bacterium]|jgi:4-diphosphocytidyl-2-C-methyl-D-erythritol kinase|nr:4-diphosphocytidyl-2-C-methyl-D-erythritol kinase [Pseudonocardiales bacterium]
MPLDEPARRVRVRVPAKINLHLGVGPVRADGYHELVTVFQAVDLVDEVIATESLGLSLQLTGRDAEALPTGPDNLAWQAASLLAERAQVPPDVRLEIAKAIPVAGGMAGGSADAAGALLACAHLWQTGSSKSDLLALAARLGSDVPFALTGGTALGTGRGELLTPALSTGQFHWVLALADFGISAADAYRELDRQRVEGAAPLPAGSPDLLLDALRAGDAQRVAGALVNDLQPASVALAPRLRQTLAAGTDLGALAGMVSGSGPTCAFLCASAEAAARLAAGLAAEGVCRTTRVATGPVPGARVVF